MRTNSEVTIYIFVAVYSICFLKSCNCMEYNGARIITYGDPCIITSRLAFQIEGPKPPPKKEKEPMSLNFRVVSDMDTQSYHIDYPISIEVPCTESSTSENLVDNLRGKSYAYNTYVPSESNPSPSATGYNFEVERPMIEKDDSTKLKQVQRLKGLKSRIDRILVPACEVPVQLSQCRC